MTRFIYVIALTFLLSTAGPLTAKADQRWDSIAAGCTPYYPAGATATNSGGWIYFLGSHGVAEFICSLTTDGLLSISPVYLDIEYWDNSTAAGNYVEATLYRMNRSTGVSTAISYVTSNTCPGALYCTSIFSEVFDSYTYSYFVRVKMSKSSSLYDVKFRGTSVWQY